MKAVTAALHRVTRLAILRPLSMGLWPIRPALARSLPLGDLVVIVVFLAISVAWLLVSPLLA